MGHDGTIGKMVMQSTVLRVGIFMRDCGDVSFVRSMMMLFNFDAFPINLSSATCYRVVAITICFA
jgi:hypothetical protein